MADDFDIDKVNILPIDKKGNLEIAKDTLCLDFWPSVYILYDDTTHFIYVGETADIKTRIKIHSKHNIKGKLKHRIVLNSVYFNKSVTLQLEAYLISYLSADRKYKLLNGNLGLRKHNYFNQDEYEKVYSKIWDHLKAKLIVNKTIEELTPTNEFKYTPFKSLNIDQQRATIAVLEGLRDGKKTIVIRGIAGTGKTVLATYLMKLLATPITELDAEELDDSFSIQSAALLRELQPQLVDSPKDDLALVVPMTSLRGTISKVFAKIEKLSSKMVISPSKVTKHLYKLLIVDEAHRLRRRVGLTNFSSILDKPNKVLGFPKETNELTWMLRRSQARILFYDELQSIRPSDVLEEEFTELMNKSDTLVVTLQTQIRSKGGVLYTDFVFRLMRGLLKSKERFNSDHYELFLVERFQDLVDKIRNDETGYSRLVSGFAWDWASKKDKDVNDIDIEDIELMWNTTVEDWVNSPNAKNEVGCIHTVQGYEMPYVGVIFGKDIGYDLEKEELFICKYEYKDKKGKATAEPHEIKRYITNIYSTLLLRAELGTYIYCCDPGLRTYFKRHIKLYKSSDQ